MTVVSRQPIIASGPAGIYIHELNARNCSSFAIK